MRRFFCLVILMVVLSSILVWDGTKNDFDSYDKAIVLCGDDCWVLYTGDDDIFN